jgi:predicted nuclease of predicted toxin-antitoxin system
MRFLADESVDQRTVQRLLDDGHELVVARLDLSGKKDPEVLAAANAHGSILITEDKDFGELVFRLKAAHAGVVLIRMNGMSGSEQADHVSQAIAERGNDLLHAFTVIGRSRMRVRRD